MNTFFGVSIFRDAFLRLRPPNEEDKRMVLQEKETVIYVKESDKLSCTVWNNEVMDAGGVHR